MVTSTPRPAAIHGMAPMTTENMTPDQPLPSAPPALPPEAPAIAAATPDEEPESAAETVAEETPAAPVAPNKWLWYVVKVQSGREESIKEAIEKKVKIEGLQEYFGQIVIPTEKVSEMRKGKRYIRERKLLPGYLMAQVEFNEGMLYLFRDTSGVGDFVGAGLNKKPLPMSDNEVKKWIKPAGDTPSAPTTATASPYSEGDKVKVKDGMFAGMEGSVKTVLEAKGAVVVELTIFGRPVPVELEYWQVDFAE
jgi:transcription termination/antitermination protein NusG